MLGAAYLRENIVSLILASQTLDKINLYHFNMYLLICTMYILCRSSFNLLYYNMQLIKQTYLILYKQFYN